VRQRILLIMSGLVLATSVVHAGDVEIQNVYLYQQSSSWRADVTLKHADTGWEHYADAWRIVDATGKLIATRVLYHPHVNEQPFTRSLGNIEIPAGTDIIFVEAHDKQHGWSPQRIKVDLSTSSGDRYHIRRQ
jgi:hypothetical protein